MTTRNTLSNNYHITIPSEISKDTDYKLSLQRAIYERTMEDQFIHNTEVVMTPSI